MVLDAIGPDGKVASFQQYVNTAHQQDVEAAGRQLLRDLRTLHQPGQVPSRSTVTTRERTHGRWST
jgi:hypothetical protein